MLILVILSSSYYTKLDELTLGANWDAFDECITDLTWCPAQRYVILYDHADIFAQAEPTQYQIALDILNSAKEYWEGNNISFKFLTIKK
jgi:hypothetical protein